MFTLQVLKRFRKTFGSRTTAAPQRPRLKPRLEWLEDRMCPGGGGGNTDTMVWKPQNLSHDSEVASNWFDQNTGKTSTTIPGPGNPVIFDGNVSTSAITWGPQIVASMTLQNGYSTRMTMAGTEVDVEGSVIQKDLNSILNVNMQTNNNVLKVQVQGGNSTLTGFDFDGQLGEFDIVEGTMTFAGSYSSDSVIGNYSTLNLSAGSSGSLKDGASLRNNSTVNVDGSKGGSMLSSDGSAGCIINNGSTMNLNGIAGGPGVTLSIPVLNSGELNVNGGGSALQAGEAFTLNGQDAMTKNCDLDMPVGTNGTFVNLSGSTTLVLDNGYSQEGGTFQTTDSLVETLKIYGTGTANVTGGFIKMGGSSYGELDVLCSVFNMSAELDVKVNGGLDGQCDVLKILGGGKLNIQNGSTLTVTILGGQPALGNAYWIIRNGGQALNQFTNQTLNGLVVNATKLTQGQYELDQP